MTAHWITEIKGCKYNQLCSNCNQKAINHTKSNYCPHCGANMSEPEKTIDKSTHAIPPMK